MVQGFKEKKVLDAYTKTSFLAIFNILSTLERKLAI